MTKEEAMEEIRLRLNRETSYVLAAAIPGVLDSQVKFLKEKIKDNSETIRLLGEFIGGEWEDFYKMRYWEKEKV